MNLISLFMESFLYNFENHLWFWQFRNHTCFYIWFIIIFFIGFGIWLFVSFHNSQKRVSGILNKLSSLTRNSINQQTQLDLKEYFDKQKNAKEIWHEFDESLVKIGENEIYNTIDASFFFNSESLGAGFIDNRLFASVPGLLTALGVLGTFYGLSKGLSGIILSSNDIDLMKQGITILLAGAGTAFMTSLWGVGLSFIYNIIEKFLERVLQNKIKKLQDKIDEIFPRKTAETQLQDIVNHTNESQEVLKGLADQIGNRLQEAVESAADTMGKSVANTLEKTLGGALNRLNGGNEEALKGLLEKFSQGLKESGANSGEKLENAANENRKTFETFSQTMTNFISNFDERMITQEERDISRNDSLKKVVDDIAKQSQIASNKLGDAVDKLITQLGSEVSKTISEIANEDKKRSEEKLTESQQINQLITGQTSKVQMLLSQSERLTNSVDRIGDANLKIAEELNKASSEIHATSSEFKTAGISIASGVSDLGNKIHITGKTIDAMAEVNNDSIEKLADIQNKFKQQYNALKEVVVTVDQLAMGAENTFENLTDKQHKFIEEFREAIEDVQVKVSGFLNKYANEVNTQTNHRMNEWNNQTLKYTGQMINVIDAMSSIVDEIDDKMSRIRK